MKPIPDSCWPYSNDKVSCHITNKPLHIIYYAQVKGLRWRGNVGGITVYHHDRGERRSCLVNNVWKTPPSTITGSVPVLTVV